MSPSHNKPPDNQRRLDEQRKFNPQDKFPRHSKAQTLRRGEGWPKPPKFPNFSARSFIPRRPGMRGK